MKAIQKQSTTAATVQRKSEQPFFQKQGEEAAVAPEREAFLSGGNKTGVENRSDSPFFQKPSRPVIQAKLTIGQPGDPYEQEADAMAEKVVQRLAMDDIQPASNKTTPALQAKCASCEKEEKIDKKEEQDEELQETGVEIQAKPIFDSAVDPPKGDIVQMACAECEKEESLINAKPEIPELPPIDKEKKEPTQGQPETVKGVEEKTDKALPSKDDNSEKIELPQIEQKDKNENDISAKPESNLATTEPSGFESNLNSTKGKGSSMDSIARTGMEKQFATDFSQVRIHTDSSAIQMNKNIGAKAFTHKNDIYFGEGEYDTASTSGKQLLAHELTHTIQQGASNNTIQRFVAPERTVEPAIIPEKPDDGAEVEGRMNDKIVNDPDVQEGNDLSPEEKKEYENPDRGEVRQESSEIQESGQSKPEIDRGAASELKTTEQKKQTEEQILQQPEEVKEEKKEGKKEAETKATKADASAQRAKEFEQRANSVTIPEKPQPFEQPKIETPVDSEGEPLTRNSAVDTQVRGLGMVGEMLREKGYEVKEHAVQKKIHAFALDAVVEKLREDLANAEEGTAKIKDHNEGRKEISQKSKEAHQESEERKTFVGEKAPELAKEAGEGGKDSGELAADAKQKSEKSKSSMPDDPDAREDAEKQSGEMNEASDGAMKMDEAIIKTGESAKQYIQDAALAAEQNQQSQVAITETDQTIAQIDARGAEMDAKNQVSKAQIENASKGPEQIRQHSERAEQSGNELIAASIIMETDLKSIQEEYLAKMAVIESKADAEARIKEEQAKGGGEKEMSPEQMELFAIAGMPEEEQEKHISQIDEPHKNKLLAVLEKMIIETPDKGTDETEGQRRQVNTGLSEEIVSGEPPDPRSPQIQEVENQRISRLGGVMDIADQNMNRLTFEQQQLLAEKLTAEAITDDIKNINVLKMGKEMLQGMVDPRMSLVGIVGGFEKMLTGFANVGNWEAWKKDPVGNLLQIAADVSTGLAMIFSSILGIAALLTALMVALIIISWGVLAPAFAIPLGWMGTIMTYAGWGAIISGSLSVYFNRLAYIKNLHDAGTADTARELFGNVEQMKQNATDGFQGAMAIVEGIGAVKMGPKLSSGEFLASVPKNPKQFAVQTLQTIKGGAKAIVGAPAAIARGIGKLFRGGKRALIGLKNKIQRFFSGKHRTGDIDIDTPQARQQHQHNLDNAADKRLDDMSDPEFRAEMNEMADSRPRKVDDPQLAKDYDVEIESNGHTYRRRKDGKGWCRFSAKDCGISDNDLPDKVKENIRDVERSSKPKDVDDVSDKHERMDDDSEHFGSELDEAGKKKFSDPEVEKQYQKYVERKKAKGKKDSIRDRSDWKETSEWWKERMERGRKFNEERAAHYEHNELYIEKEPPVKGQYNRVDSFDPKKPEIVSRKETQLGEIDVASAQKYIDEMVEKYPPGRKIAKVASTDPKNSGKGKFVHDNTKIFSKTKTLKGDMVLEVPEQKFPIDKALLDYATKKKVIIRDVKGVELNPRSKK